MKAIVQRQYSSPDLLRLQEIDQPVVGDAEVLVRVNAASVNPADWHVMRGSPYFVLLAGYGLRRPKNPVPGMDVAGVVETVGKNVTALRPGDEVFGWCRGAYAEYAPAAEDRLAPKPAGTPGANVSVIRHRGRTSGRAYETPVGVVATDDGFLIAMPYGLQANWLRNLLASGSAAIVHEGLTHAVDQPEIVPMREVATRFPASDQLGFRVLRVDQCLRVRPVETDEAAGRFSDAQ